MNQSIRLFTHERSLSESNYNMKKILINLTKLSVAFGLIYWLVKDGKIDFSQTSIFLNSPSLITMHICYWLFIGIGVGAYRWSALLSGLGIIVNYFKVVYFTLIGFFFNTAMPGAVGGDLIKAIYILRDSGGLKKTPVILSILLDRVMGLAGLFTLAFLGVVLNWTVLSVNPALAGMAYLVVGIYLAILIFFTLVFIPLGKADLFRQILSQRFIGFKFLLRVYLAFCEYRKSPRSICIALICSIVIQGFVIFFMWYIAGLLNLTQGISLGVFASIAPLGILTTALPLAPGGMGVGHVAFDKIFAIAGVEGGANIFNIFFLGQICLNLLGVIPYLFFKKPTSEEIEIEQAV